MIIISKYISVSTGNDAKLKLPYYKRDGSRCADDHRRYLSRLY